ncbi:MAG: TetR/AcrR family transcriptional regulator [Coprobacillus sp.]|nr:TetR/AcrR family transcriptional regulator [Coprobacillus sp.]
MKTEYKFIEALKYMMAEQPLETISVAAISKKCGVQRQTFYYYFNDIYDLIMVTFLNEKITEINFVKTFDEMLDCFFAYYKTNKKFLDAIIDSAGKDSFVEFIQNNAYQTYLRFVNMVNDSKELTAVEKKSIARYHANAFSNVFINYLSSHKQKTFPELKSQFVFLKDDFIKEAVNEIVRKKKKNSSTQAAKK